MSSKRIIQKILFNKWSYKLVHPFIYAANRLSASKKNFEEAAKEDVLYKSATDLFSDKKIKHGPFKNMLFNWGNTGASSNFAKMLGSYESEIHPFIKAALQNNYANLINIGSDDGYYAIGFGVKMQSLKIYAFDTNKEAWPILQQNAKLNGVGERTLQAGLFSKKDLEIFADGQRNLFVVDCEGAEKEIFTEAAVKGLINSDLIIELHLHIHPELDIYFRNLFSATHEIVFQDSVPDYLKARVNNYPELAQANFELKKYITGERDVFMQWILLRSKIHLNAAK